MSRQGRNQKSRQKVREANSICFYFWGGVLCSYLILVSTQLLCTSIGLLWKLDYLECSNNIFVHCKWCVLLMYLYEILSKILKIFTLCLVHVPGMVTPENLIIILICYMCEAYKNSCDKYRELILRVQWIM